MKNNKGFVPIAIVLIIIAVLAVGGVAYYVGKSSNTSPQKVEENIFPQENQVANNTQSDCLPTMAPWIKVLSPNGGETYVMGQLINITWKTCNAKSGQTITLGIGKEISASQNNGISGAFNPSVSFYPSQIINDGIEAVTLSGSSTNGNWPFTPGTNYKVSAILNPLPTSTQETPFVQDSSDNSFTIKEIHKLMSFTGSDGIFVASSQGITEVKVFYYRKDNETIEKLFGSMELVDTNKNSKAQTWTLPPGASQTLADWATKIYAIGYSGDDKSKKENQIDYKYSGPSLSRQSLYQ